DNMVIFGMTAETVAETRARAEEPLLAIERSPMLRDALEAIASGVFSPDDPHRYRDLINGIYEHDWFMVARDFDAYARAQPQDDQMWRDRRRWYVMAIRNTTH